jgi:hypothetical protein
VTGASEHNEVPVEWDVAVPMPGGARLRVGPWRPIDAPSQLTGPLLCGGWWP